MTNYIERAYVVSLQPDRANRWGKFDSLGDPRIQLFSATDTRTTWKAKKHLEKNGFYLNPLPGACSDYFSQSLGAVGCYISHYKIWKNIIKCGYECSLVLEDDAVIADVVSVLNVDTVADPGFLCAGLIDPFHLIQLNKRTPMDRKIAMFAGTEGYLLSLEGARRLVYLAENAGVFMNKVNKPLCLKNDELPDETRCFFSETDGKRMWIAVDKFMGLCGMSTIPSEHRVNIAVVPRIGLRETQVESDVMDVSEFKPHWKLKPKPLARFRKRANYCWWEPKRKVFEIGVKKTGTSSLGGAFRILKYRVAAWHPDLYRHWKLTGECNKILEACENYDMFEDGPWHDCDFRVLHEKYPNALFIMMDRDNESWLESLEKHEAPYLNVNDIEADWLEQRWITDKDNYIKEMTEFKHTKYNTIREYFKEYPDQFLEMNIFEDPDPMKTLCEFLDVTVPDEPFPHNNKSK